MSLFNNIKIKSYQKESILQYLDNPTLSAWNNICDIYITKRHALWRAMAGIQPSFFEQWDEKKIMWKNFPDSITLARAIKHAVKEQEAWEDDLLFFPGPRAA